MGQKQRRARGNQHKNKKHHRQLKPKHFEKHTDQIYDDVNDQTKAEKLLNQEVDEDLPGFGQFYCLQCARYFVNHASLETHLGTKVHKKALKRLSEKPYDHEEAERCGI